MKKIKRFLSEKLVRKIFSTEGSPEYLARSVVVGTAVSLTPTFGVQMGIIWLIWVVLRNFKKLDFSFTIAFLMTWILMNHFTMLPYYFIAYVTGAEIQNFFFGMHSPLGYSDFISSWQPVLETAFPYSIVEFAKLLFRMGISMFIGSLPYDFIACVVLYFFTVKSVKRYRR